MAAEGANLGCAMMDSNDVCVSCTYGYYVTSKDSATPVTCAKSDRYSGVSRIYGFMLIFLSLLNF